MKCNVLGYIWTFKGEHTGDTEPADLNSTTDDTELDIHEYLWSFIIQSIVLFVTQKRSGSQ